MKTIQWTVFEQKCIDSFISGELPWHFSDWESSHYYRKIDGQRESKGLPTVGAFPRVSISVSFLAPDFPGLDWGEEREIGGT